MPLIGGMYNTAEVMSNLFGKDNEFDNASGNVFNQLAKGADNYLRSALHTGLTDEELQRNALMRENRQTEMSDAVKGLEAAGLNAGLVYGSSPSTGNPQSSPGSSTAGLGELLQLAMMPAQIANLNAQTSNIKAQTGLTEQKTRTEEQISRIKKIAADFGVEFTQTQIDSMLADIANKDADTDMKRSQTDLIDSQKTAQDIANEYLPSKYFVEIDKLSADAAFARANEAMQRVQYEYARENGVLMSNNDLITLATYLIDLFGISKSDAKARAGKVIEVVNGANNWIDGKIQQASDWFDSKVVNRIKNRLNRN